MSFETNIFLWETQDVFLDTTILVDGVKWSHAYLTRTVPSYEYMITSCDATNSDECVSHVDMFCKCKQRVSRSRLHLQKSGCRIRDLQPSRVSLRKVIRKLRCRKLRKKNKKMLKNTVPVSSYLHSIAAKYKQRNIRCIQKQDSSFGKYFVTSKRSTVTYNASYNLEILNQIQDLYQIIEQYAMRGLTPC